MPHMETMPVATSSRKRRAPKGNSSDEPIQRKRKMSRTAPLHPRFLFPFGLSPLDSRPQRVRHTQGPQNTLNAVNTSQQPENVALLPALNPNNDGSSRTKYRRTSKFFDPLNPTKSLFERPSVSRSSSERPQAPGIIIPQIDNLLPETSWPPPKPKNWKASRLQTQVGQKAVPAKLKVPKPLQLVKHPELFEVSMRSLQKGNKQTKRTEKATDLTSCGTGRPGFQHASLPANQNGDEDFLMGIEKLPAKSALAHHRNHGSDACTTLKGGHASNTQNASKPKNPMLAYGDATIGKQFQIFPISPGKRTLLKLQGNKWSPVGVRKVSCNRISLEEDKTRGRPFESTREGSAMQPVDRTPETTTAISCKLVNAGNRRIEVTTGCVFPEVRDYNHVMQPVFYGLQKPLKENKSVSPRRITDLDLSNNTDPASTAPYPSLPDCSPAVPNTSEHTADQANPERFGETLVSYKQFPKRNADDVATEPPKNLSQICRAPVEDILGGISAFGNTASRACNSSSAADDSRELITIGDSIPSEPEMLTYGGQGENQSSNIHIQGLPDLRSNEILQYDALPEELVDPKNFAWMQSDFIHIRTDPIPTQVELARRSKGYINGNY